MVTHTHTKGGRERLERLIFFERFRKKEKEKKELVKHTQKKKKTVTLIILHPLKKRAKNKK
jgi:hypothetical protein